MKIDGPDKCDNIGLNAETIKGNIKELCKNGACSGEFEDGLFPRKFIRIKYICEGNYNISRRGFMLLMQCNKCDISKHFSCETHDIMYTK